MSNTTVDVKSIWLRHSVDEVVSDSELAVMPVCSEGHGAGHRWETVILIHNSSWEYSAVDYLERGRHGASEAFDYTTRAGLTCWHTFSINPYWVCYYSTHKGRKRKQHTKNTHFSFKDKQSNPLAALSFVPLLVVTSPDGRGRWIEEGELPACVLFVAVARLYKIPL